MKRTLIEMVQDILSALDAEEVNSIDDTLEATQVANIIKNCYLNMATTRNWTGQRKLLSFNHSATLDRPTHIRSPENIKEMILFKYNVAKEDDQMEYREISYREPDVFLRLVSSRGVDTPNTKIITDTGGTPLVIITNKPPSYWTSFDDTYIVCDSYDSQVDDTLKASKTQVLAYMYPEFKLLDSFVPEMPAEAFQALYNESKSIAFVEVKQVANQKAEQEATRQRVWLSRNDFQLKGGTRYPNYGRRVVK